MRRGLPIVDVPGRCSVAGEALQEMSEGDRGGGKASESQGCAEQAAGREALRREAFGVKGF